MFHWDQQHSLEVDASVEEAWNFYADPSHWPKWDTKFDWCLLEGAFEPGAQIRAKVKNKPHTLPILVTDVRPHAEFKLLIKNLFCTQETLITFKTLGSGKTQIKTRLFLFSLLLPFMRSQLANEREACHGKSLPAFNEYLEQVRRSSLSETFKKGF